MCAYVQMPAETRSGYWSPGAGVTGAGHDAGI